jgi:hypothetical protein
MWITVFAITTAMALSCVVMAIVVEYRERQHVSTFGR